MTEEKARKAKIYGKQVSPYLILRVIVNSGSLRIKYSVIKKVKEINF